MNWKLKLVLAFAKFKNPLNGNNIDINYMRKDAKFSSKMGGLLFDKTVKISNIQNFIIDNNIPIRLYKNAELPNQKVIVYYHGGGFVAYNLDSHDNICRRLCVMNNCIVLSVDYRLAPENPYPAAHNDAYTALIWVKNNIEKYGGNAHKIILAGDSAGGTLAACIAHKCKKENIPIAAQILVYPWVDGNGNSQSMTTNGTGYMLTNTGIKWFQQLYTPNKEDRCKPEVSPIFENDFSNLPPTFVITAELDPLLDEGFAYYEKLKNANNKVEYKEYKKLIHGFFNIPKIDKEAMQCYYDIKDFLNRID